VTRLEDYRFIRGAGCFTEDMAVGDGTLFAVFVRSPHAHAQIENVRSSETLAVPGVIGVLTGQDVADDELGAIPSIVDVVGSDGCRFVEPPRFPLVQDRARFVGDPVALVVAEDIHAAENGAEALAVDYTVLPHVVDVERSLAPNAVNIWPMAAGNLSLEWSKGDAAAVEAAFSAAAFRVHLQCRINRLVGNAVEPRAAIAEYDQASDTATLHTPSQGAHLLQRLLADNVFRIPRSRLRVRTPDVGGGFGPKYFAYPEQAAIVWASRRFGRPVRWLASRAESFLSDTQSRDQVIDGALALDEEGHVLAFRLDGTADLGAYVSTFGPSVPTESMAKVATGLYQIPAVHLNMRLTFTNRAPVDAYRGAGKPGVLFLLERLMDQAALEIDIDPAELRRRNLVPAAAMPYRDVFGNVHDSGDYPKVLDQALARADWQGVGRRRAATAGQGLLRGRGLSCYSHGTGGIVDEESELEVDPAGIIVARTGTQSSGQGHETVFADVVAAELGLTREDINVRQGDTAELGRGGGTGGSSSAIISAPTLKSAAIKIIQTGTRLAAQALEAAEADISYASGRFSITGTDRGIGLYAVAERFGDLTGAPGGERVRWVERVAFDGTVVTYPNGCQVAEVEVDPETGAVRLVSLISVDDVGHRLNTILVDGQMHGGIVQGLGQALLEHCHYDPDSGQLLTGSLMDYAVPRADTVPPIETVDAAMPTATNTLGVKGVGELGTNGTPPAIVNAVVDALSHLGVRHLHMPLTPEKVWRAIHSADRPNTKGNS